MLRGIVMLSKNQVERLLKLVDNEKYKDSLMYVKLKSASSQSMEFIPVEFSEEEVEILIDELDPNPSDDLRAVLTATMLSWRS